MTEIVLTKPSYTEDQIASASISEVSSYSKSTTELVNTVSATFTKITTSCSSGTNDEINIAIPTGHTILYVYPDELSSIGFDTTSGDSNGDNSLRIEAGKMQKFYIPNGATHVHIEGQGASGDKFCYVVTG